MDGDGETCLRTRTDGRTDGQTDRDGRDGPVGLPPGPYRETGGGAFCRRVRSIRRISWLMSAPGRLTEPPPPPLSSSWPAWCTPQSAASTEDRSSEERSEAGTAAESTDRAVRSERRSGARREGGNASGPAGITLAARTADQSHGGSYSTQYTRSTAHRLGL